MGTLYVSTSCVPGQKKDGATVPYAGHASHVLSMCR